MLTGGVIAVSLVAALAEGCLWDSQEDADVKTVDDGLHRMLVA